MLSLPHNTNPMENQIVIYQTDNGQTAIDVRLENETVWLTANQMAFLFDRNEKTIRKHINNVFSENELDKDNNTHFLRVEVLEPLWLRKEMAGMVKRMWNNYSKK